MTIPIHVNNAQTTLGASYSIGGSTLTMATGYGTTLAAKLTALGHTLGASAPLRVTAIKSTALNVYGQITDLSKLTIFEATGRSGDVLTGVSVVEGTTDQAFAAGDTLAFLWTAGAAKELRDAINAGSGSVTSVALTVPTGLSVSGSPITSSGTLAVTLGVSGILKGSGGSFVAATAGTDYAAASHNHDDRYYTESEIDTLLTGIGGAADLDDLTDVAITSPASNQVLYYNGSAWVNGAVPTHSHAASDITSGTIATARLASGSASSSTFLRGDQTWATVSASPAGFGGEIQYNNAGAFGGFGSWDGTTLAMPSGGGRISFNSSSQQYLRAGSFTLMHTSGSLTNYFAGIAAGNTSTSGGGNTAIGVSALSGNTSGSNNTVIGADAGKNGSVLSACILVGSNAGVNLATSGGSASNVIGIGNSALSTATNATYVLAIGDCLTAATSLSYCQAVGAACATTVTSPSRVAVFGTAVCQATGTMSNLTGMGADTLKNATTATDTVAYGSDAGGAITGTASGCTFVGHNAGGASPTPTGLTNAIGLGKNAQPPADYVAAIGGTGSSAVVIAIGDRAFPSDSAIQDGQVLMRYDSTAGSAKIMFRGKNASGTVVSGNLALT
jgi:hypothetical protein